MVTTESPISLLVSLRVVTGNSKTLSKILRLYGRCVLETAEVPAMNRPFRSYMAVIDAELKLFGLRRGGETTG